MQGGGGVVGGVVQLAEHGGQTLGQRVVGQVGLLGHQRRQPAHLNLRHGRGLGRGRLRASWHQPRHLQNIVIQIFFRRSNIFRGHLSHYHHLDLAAGGLEDADCLVVVHVDAGDPVHGEQLVVHPEPGLVRGAAGRHAGDEDALVVAAEGGGAEAARDAEAEPLVGAAEADLVHHLLHRHLGPAGGKLVSAEEDSA